MTTATEDHAVLDLGVVAGLTASLGKVSTELERLNERQARLEQHVRRFTIPPQAITLSTGAGTLDVPNLLGPRTGNFWDIRKIACTGFTAGTVTIYLSQNGGEVVDYFSAQGVNKYGKGQTLIGAGDRLYFSAASITGTVTVSLSGTEISATYIGDYLL